MAIDIHKLLADSLLDLCKKKKLDQITIKDLLKETGISRQTFYNRFRDKNDLIQWVYENRILSEFLVAGEDGTYYQNTLNYCRALDKYRFFMKQACKIEGQNCLKKSIFEYAIAYDLQWHQKHYGDKPLPEDLVYLSRYHSVASITSEIDWITSDNPEPPEVIAKRITQVRKISLSDVFFGPNNKIYDYQE